jgi:tripartite-type tricarboxylate transporter receptor subunit TctC
VIDKVVKVLKGLAQNEEFKTRMQNIGVEVICNTPEEFQQILKQDLTKWAEAVKMTGATIN